MPYLFTLVTFTEFAVVFQCSDWSAAAIDVWGMSRPLTTLTHPGPASLFSV